MFTVEGRKRESERERTPEPQPRVFKGGEEFQSNVLHSVAALGIWLGAIHFNLALVLFSLLFLPLSYALLVFGLLVLFIVIPVDDKSILGRQLSRSTASLFPPLRSYFPVTLRVEDMQAFHPDRAYVFGYEPHSVLPIGFVALSNLTGFMPLPKIKFLGTSALFWVPFLRQIWTWFGFAPVTKRSFTSLLEAGYSCVVVPGGVHETVLVERDSEIALLKTRRGFVRIAMETGHPLVPVFCFGQSHLYKWWKPDGKFFLQVSRAIRLPLICFWGILGSPLPYRHPLHVVVGRPIELQKNPHPTMDEIIEAHSQFVEALEDLFERHKARIGCADVKLKIL